MKPEDIKKLTIVEENKKVREIDSITKNVMDEGYSITLKEKKIRKTPAERQADAVEEIRDILKGLSDYYTKK